MRKARLRSFNDYREAYGLNRLASFDELTADASRSRTPGGALRRHRQSRVVRRHLRRGLPRLHDDGRAADHDGGQRRVHPGADQPAARPQRLQRARRSRRPA